MNAPFLVRNLHGTALRQLATAEHRRRGSLVRARSAISRTLTGFAEGVAEARRMARIYDKLAAMSDPELQDIGINRSDIPAVVSGAYRRKSPPISDLTSPGRRASRHRQSAAANPCDQGVSP